MKPLALAAAAACALAACVSPVVPALAGRPPIAPQARYVAMGSSFAAGAGIAPAADRPSGRCGRSQANYAQLLARELALDLTDVSCGGATSEHILGRWNELPPQIDAVTPDTALVTITIGGNDVGFVRFLFVSACQGGGAPPPPQLAAMCRGLAAMAPNAAADTAHRAAALPDEAAWQALAGRLRRINAEIRRRAPGARIVYVNYVTLIPAGARCPEVPLSPERAAMARAMAARLAAVTARAAKADGAQLIDAARLSRGHDACAAEPWSTGLIPRTGFPASAPYHPNAKAMEAIAGALAARLRKG